MISREPIPSSELIINSDGSIFHLHIKPEQLADKIIVCGDPARVDKIASYLDSHECSVTSREFHTVTGMYKGKRLSIVSHGIGCDNIEIVLNELDALANIDFETRMIKPDPKKLTIVRIGTSGGLQDESPIGTYVAAEYAIGFDGVLHFYGAGKDVADRDFEKALIAGLDWKIDGLKPYVVKSPQSIVDRICKDDVLRGVTIACNGFYAPQGRRLRWDLADPTLNQKIQSFEHNGRKITNFEMESSALAGIGAVLGHEVLTVCCIIAGRKAKKMNTDYKDSLDGLIELVLERI
ncbi:nucleoside phosphorylase [Porphyromonas cangingivalis]|uniref:Uridine phosphorylase n=1 Tax=Porphyromonas cangingivalis TaxID=36874 RepID=A0A099WTW9_PORCN|nr:nucleoside phosphorylase [Porphyromonas cangingivalis]KGL47520.1 phosphorylase [Porphyromonas cangingivalis]KGN83048.1 phosphorylase [Porphyromonas cangingivalis]SJZ75825.1 uridine phosphorylase [Porphyromonas cangingivalis]SPY36151.1 Uridine phosphorylase [Porphyromonas cangingivalis]VEJ04825.1 Uridine phosphorylase [Porphyromonas cangingivalis]